jgi:SAM-dependent methyltransferase
MERPEYGCWVSESMNKRFLANGIALAIVDAALWVLLPGWLPLNVVVGAFALFFLGFFAYFTNARRLFSPQGGGVQEKVLDKVLSCVGWDGRGEALDIGCGGGALAVRVAKAYPEARVIGVDSWGEGWGYSGEQCEKNAALEGVSERTRFIRASAVKLPFPDGTFDLVVSNLVFLRCGRKRTSGRWLAKRCGCSKRAAPSRFRICFSYARTTGISGT